ncbi:MAG: hypothetical protein M9939_04545 [Mesorhizobium sp.]|nr:hypothetical protein [Mesorhizobium sp.]MCO5160379.1 hypothetical protein [Mesorhizobium sp.]
MRLSAKALWRFVARNDRPFGHDFDLMPPIVAEIVLEAEPDARGENIARDNALHIETLLQIQFVVELEVVSGTFEFVREHVARIPAHSTDDRSADLVERHVVGHGEDAPDSRLDIQQRYF